MRALGGDGWAGLLASGRIEQAVGSSRAGDAARSAPGVAAHYAHTKAAARSSEGRAKAASRCARWGRGVRPAAAERQPPAQLCCHCIHFGAAAPAQLRRGGGAARPGAAPPRGAPPPQGAAARAAVRSSQAGGACRQSEGTTITSPNASKRLQLPRACLWPSSNCLPAIRTCPGSRPHASPAARPPTGQLPPPLCPARPPPRPARPPAAAGPLPLPREGRTVVSSKAMRMRSSWTSWWGAWGNGQSHGETGELSTLCALC